MASVSIKLKLILYSLFLIVFSAVGLAGGVALHDWNEAERDNAKRIEAAVESQQRILEQSITGDMAFLKRFLHRIEMLKAYRKVTALDFSLPGHVDFTQALGSQLGAEYFAYYYEVGERETQQLRHLYSKPDGGAFLYVQRDEKLHIKKLETTDDGRTNFVDGSPTGNVLEMDYSAPDAMISYSLLDGQLMLRSHIPYTVGAEGSQVGVTPGDSLGTFVVIKPVVEDIHRLDVDYGVNFTFFTVDGEKGAGAVAFTDLDVSTYANSGMPVRVVDDTGEQYDMVVRPVMSEDQVVGYISAAKSRSAVMASLMKKVSTMALITCLILAVVLLFAWIAVRRFMEPVNRTVSFAKAVAEGDLEQELAIRRTDELGVLADALRGMVSSLKDMIKQAEAKTREAEEESRKANEATQKADEARRQAEQARRDGTMLAAQRLEGIVQRVTVSAGELAGLADESFKGAEIQRERSAESAGAMEQMNATVVEMARNADEAVQNANEARENAERGEDIVRRLVTSINTVNDKAATMANGINVLGDRAQNIGQVMDVISDIADQTNLLALNAAIEAARAGESGRGFAVVADEVRKLAEKTMQATKEVGEAVKAIQDGTQTTIRYVEDAEKAVKESTDLASDAGESLRSIVRVVSSNAENVQAIAAAAGEQSEASNFITKGVDEVSMIANDTAESMRKSSEAITEISGLTNELQQLMNELQQE